MEKPERPGEDADAAAIQEYRDKMETWRMLQGLDKVGDEE